MTEPARAKITLRDGRVVYETVMFPGDPYWAETIKGDPNVKYIELLLPEGEKDHD